MTKVYRLGVHRTTDGRVITAYSEVRPTTPWIYGPIGATILAALVAISIVGASTVAIGAILSLIHPDCGVLASVSCVRL